VSGTYVIRNTSKKVHTRTTRAMTPGRKSAVQRVCGGKVRLSRGDSVVITEDQFRTHYVELAQACARGLIEVHEGAFNGPVVKFNGAPPAGTPQEEPEEVVIDVQPEPSTQEVQDPASAAEPVEDDEVSVELEAEPQLARPEPDKPLDKMNKAELIEYASEVLGERQEDLELLTKRQILEKIS